MLGAHFACGEIDIGQGVKLVDHDVDIVGTDAVAQAHDRLALIGAAYGVELARRHLEGLAVEKRGDHIDTTRIADQDYTVGELFGQKVKVKHRSVGVDDQFRGSYLFLFHILEF